MYSKYGGEPLNRVSYTKEMFIDVLIGLIHVLIGIKTLNELKIMHDDIKPANIVYSKVDKLCRIIDFGEAYKFDDITGETLIKKCRIEGNATK